MALTVVSGAAMISVLTLQRGIAQWKNQSAASSQKLAFYYAEAGLAESLDALRAGSSGNVGTLEIPAVFGDGAFWVEALEDEHGVVHLTSTGLHGPTAYRLTQSVHKPKLPLGDYGFFGQHGVELGDGVVVSLLDVQDEGGGDAGDGAGEEDGGLLGGVLRRIALPAPVVVQEDEQPLLGSNGTIQLGFLTQVLGPALPGPGAVVENLLGALLGGSTVPAPEIRDLPELSMPVTDTDATLALGARQQLTLAPGTHEYASMSVSSRSVLTIQGPSSVFVDDLRVGTLGTLAFDTTGGAVHVYVGDLLWVAGSSRVTNSSGDASDLVILVDGRGTRDRDGDGEEDVEGPVLWETAQPMVGALYAPYASVTLPDNASWTGGITALELVVGDDAALTLDPRILEVELLAKRYHFMSWRVVEIPPAERRAIAGGLVRAAIARGDTPPAAAAARIQATNEFRIRTDDGEVVTYRGNLLSDLTQAVVDAVLPAEVKVERVPPFADYEKETEDSDDASVMRFKRAYNAMLEAIGDSGGSADRWAAALETGNIPANVVQSVHTDGDLIEPFRTALASPALREELWTNGPRAPLPAASKRLLAALISLFP